jgi:hypothetical protein
LAFLTYEVAYKLKLRGLTMHAVRHFDGYDVPATFGVREARQLGVDAYHCLIAAAESAGSKNWQDIADHVELPEE